VSIRQRPAEIQDRAVPGHGRAICLKAHGEPTLRHWWSVNRAT
jgi:hypothetical protein